MSCLFAPSQQRARMQPIFPPLFPTLHNKGGRKDCSGQGGSGQGGRKERSPLTAHLSQHNKSGRRHHDGPLKSSPQMEAAGYLCSVKNSKDYPFLPAPRVKRSIGSLSTVHPVGKAVKIAFERESKITTGRGSNKQCVLWWSSLAPLTRRGSQG